MDSSTTDGNEEINVDIQKPEKDKIIDSIDFSILKRTDYTTPLTRRLNKQPRIYANKVDLDQDIGPDSFLFSRTKTKDDLFQESQERVKRHIETIIQSQNDSFKDSFREIDEMSQENEDHLERIEKYLQKLKTKILKRRLIQQKQTNNESCKSTKADKQKECTRNQRADNLMELNQEQLK